jgi:periplasmic protein TonB
MAFEGILGIERAAPSRVRRLTVTLSLALHVAALAVGIAYSFWHVDELPLPTVAVTLAGGAPPPPPPPPPPKRHSVKPRTRPVEPKPSTLVQPTDRPKEEPKPAPEDDSKEDEKGAQDDGEEGGVAGGVKGGVVGGVVGAPLVATGPKMLPPQIGAKQLLIDPNRDPYKVELPPPLARGGMSFFAILRMCVSADGAVSDVKILRGADPAIDPQIPIVLRRWRYRPYTLDGKPTPFCYNLRYEISAR